MSRQTSIEAYKEIKNNGLLPERRLQVYQILFKYGPITAAQLIDIASKHLKVSNSGNLGTRLSELRRMGVVQEVKQDTCPLTGYKAIYWDVTSNLPTKLPKKKTYKQKYIEALEVINEANECPLTVWNPAIKRVIDNFINKEAR